MGSNHGYDRGLQSSILVLQGEGDWLTPLVEALFLEQALIEAGHRDHTLYTYPGLSHFFYPTDGWQSSMGPIEPYVLRDLYEWLISPVRTLDHVVEDTRKNAEAVQSLADELETSIESVNQSLLEAVSDIESELSQRGVTDYLIPVMIVILVLLITSVRKR